MATQTSWRVTRNPMPLSGWVAVIIPIDCDGFSLQSQAGKTWKIRTDGPNSGESEKSCTGTTQEIVLPTAASTFRGRGTRFAAGDTLCWVSSDEDDDVLIATWVGNP